MVAYVAGKPAVRSASLGFQRAGSVTREGVQAIQDLHEYKGGKLIFNFFFFFYFSIFLE